VHLANIGAVMEGWPYELREQVEVVFVSTDPERDTPERIREWLDAFDPAFVGLRGPREQVNEIERSFGLPPSFVEPGQDPEGYLVGHAAQVLAFTPDDTAHIAFPFGTRQADLAVDLPRLVREGFQPNGGP
jgi:protein SCO1/2